jgi:DNA ligase-associated metallophosphoesterase
MTPTAACARIAVRGEELLLLPQRAVWWPARALLLVADLHLGKGATLRAHGIPIPRGSSSASLARLDAVLADWPVQRVVFLGDFLHARQAQRDAPLEVLRAWRERHADLALTLVPGNHDRHAGMPPAELDIEIHADPLTAGPFALRHLPQPHADHYVLAGHLHPGVQLRGRVRESVRVPCFVFGQQRAVLPAFGEFTGLASVERVEGDRIYVCAEEAVLPLPAVDTPR